MTNSNNYSIINKLETNIFYILEILFISKAIQTYKDKVFKNIIPTLKK